MSACGRSRLAPGAWFQLIGYTLASPRVTGIALDDQPSVALRFAPLLHRIK
jgi:hypothetical protein